MHQAIEANWHTGLKSHDAEGCVIKFECFFIGVMRGVVGGDHINGPVAQAFDHRQPIGLLAQRRIHLQVRVVTGTLGQFLIVEGEVMRCHFTCHLDAARLALAHGPQRLPRTHVRQMHASTGQLRERDVALRHDRLGHAGNAAKTEHRGHGALMRDAVTLEGRVLAVLDDRHIKHRRIFQRTPHQHRRAHGVSIIGERHTPGRAEVAHLGHLVAALPHRHGTNRIHTRQVRLRCTFENELRH